MLHEQSISFAAVILCSCFLKKMWNEAGVWKVFIASRNPLDRSAEKRLNETLKRKVKSLFELETVISELVAVGHRNSES